MEVFQFIGQLMLAPFGFAPKGWAQCNGQTTAINQNQALFSLLGTVFGGDGIRTFVLPNLQGRTPIGVNTSTNYPLGANGGEALHTLVAAEIPVHTHTLQAATSGANANAPAGAALAGGGANVFVPSANLVAMIPQALSIAGGGQPHENRQPYLVMNWCIALNGIFPSRS